MKNLLNLPHRHRKFYLLVGGLAFWGLAWIAISGPLSIYIARAVGPNMPAIKVGTITKLEGRLRIRRLGDVTEWDVKDLPIDIFSGDRIETLSNGQASIALNSQDELTVEPLSEFQISIWDQANKKSPIYLEWLSQKPPQFVQQGMPGRAYFVFNGKLHRMGPLPKPKPMALTVLKDMDSELELADSGSADFESLSDTMTTETKFETSAVVHVRTLSNEYIDEVIATRQAQLHRCWIPRLRQKPDLKGALTLQIEISRRGNVKSVSVVESSLNDDELHRCVISVIDRTRFRPYSGPEISVSYPIYFE